jgi:hypothetical protein
VARRFRVIAVLHDGVCLLLYVSCEVVEGDTADLMVLFRLDSIVRSTVPPLTGRHHQVKD